MLTQFSAQWPHNMFLDSKYELLTSHAFEFVQSVTLARSWEKLHISEVGEKEEESCSTSSLLSGRRTQQSCRHMLSLIMLAGSLCWAVLSPLPHAVPAEAPLLPCVPCASVLQHRTQASLYLPLYHPVFLLLSSFLLFMSLVKSRFIHFRVPVFSLSWHSFISEPLPSFSCLTWSICKSLSYSP